MEGQWREEGGGRGAGKGGGGDEKEQKQDKRVGHIFVINKTKKLKTDRYRTTVLSVAVETTHCHDNHNAIP